MSNVLPINHKVQTARSGDILRITVGDYQITMQGDVERPTVVWLHRKGSQGRYVLDGADAWWMSHALRCSPVGDWVSIVSMHYEHCGRMTRMVFDA